VRVDLALDEVASSSSSGHYRGIDRRKKVHVADESQQVLDEASGLLTEAGLEVLVARDGDEASRLVREEHPDLVVIGLLMPGKSGFEVLREIRSDERIKDTPVLAMCRVYKESVLGFLQRVGAQGLIDQEHIRASLVFRVLTLLTPPPAVA
jgi:CheY-like chemotaxis protein